MGSLAHKYTAFSEDFFEYIEVVYFVIIPHKYFESLVFL